MAYRRIAYAALLGGAVLTFRSCSAFYLSTFTLALVLLLLPLLSVLLSLPSVLGCTLLLTSAAPTVVQGRTRSFRCGCAAAPACPCPGFRPVSTGATSSPARAGGVRWGVRTAPGAPPTLELATPHCGRLICRAERAWTCDLLGLFPLPIPTGRPAAVLILPPDMEQALPERLLGGGPGGGALLPRPGGGPGEDYDLRDYRPGTPALSPTGSSPPSGTSWCTGDPGAPADTLVLTYDHFGAPAALDQTFARLCALSRALLERGRPHHIQWASPTGGGVEGRLVDSGRPCWPAWSWQLLPARPAEDAPSWTPPTAPARPAPVPPAHPCNAHRTGRRCAMKRKRRAAAPLRRGPAILLGDGCLLLLVLAGTVFSFLTAFSVQIHALPLLLGCAAAALAFLGLWSLPRRWWALPLALLAAAWVLAVRRLWQPLALGAEALRVDVVNTVSASLELGFTLEPALSLPEALWTNCATLLVLLALVPLGALLGLGVVRLRSFWLVFVSSFPFVLLPCASRSPRAGCP
ncbi:MAG: hypothetical protein ACLRWQ_03875 [Flavonifractor plautii]